MAKTSIYQFIPFLFTLSLFCFGLNLPGTALAYDQSIPQEVKQAQKGIVKVYTSHLNGTGIIISPDTLVTNFHIVVNEEGILPIETFRLKNRIKITGIKALSPIDDLAILEIKNYEGETLKFSDSKTTTEEVYMLGFTAETLRIIKGNVTSKNDKDYRIRLFGSMPYIRGLFPYYPGMSGGPVLDAKGNLIAIIKSGEMDILRASTVKSLRALLEKSSTVSSDGKELFRTTIEELKQRARQGDLAAQYTLGDMYKKGKGVPKSYTEAHKWIKKVAEQGLAHAQLTLGLMYTEKGFENHAEARRWIRSAAEKGLPQAQLTLGFMYYIGIIFQRNHKEAYEWVKKAVEQGVPQAKLLLGHMHRRGKGAPQSDKEAYEWVKKAAEQGIPLAKHYLRFISINRWLKNTTKKVARCLTAFN